MALTYTLQYLQTRSMSELYVLRGALVRELSLAAPYSPDACKALASLDLVSRMIRMRLPSGPKL